jgi:tol-pal system protein YbgF
VTAPVRGGTKEELARLQSDVLALQSQIRMLEKGFTEQNQSLKSLIGQLNDQVGKSNAVLERISTTLDKQAAGDRASSQTLLQEVRSLGSKIEDTGAQISALARQVSEMKIESKAVTARRFQTMSGETGASAQSADTIFFEAYNDLVQGNTDLAIQGFTAYVASFPKSEKADDAQYYIGEAYYNGGKFTQAIAAFTRVLNDYPAGDRTASALYKRALAEKQINEKDNAISDLRSVVQRFPGSPEAGLATAELESLGAAAVPQQPKTPPRSRRP